MTVITETQYARIHAHAWLNAAFKVAYEKDPNDALSKPDPDKPDSTMRDYFDIGADDRFMDLTSAYHYDGLDFSKYLPAQLQELYTKGTVDGVIVTLQSSEWICPKLGSTAYNQGPDALTRGDWTRIYAYIWYQMIATNDATLKDEFELNPAQAVKDIAPKLGLPLSKPYVYQVTPVITIGDPPPYEPEKLNDIHDDARALNHRFHVRYCC
jgi:hypothetical protein